MATERISARGTFSICRLRCSRTKPMTMSPAPYRRMSASQKMCSGACSPLNKEKKPHRHQRGGEQEHHPAGPLRVETHSLLLLAQHPDPANIGPVNGPASRRDSSAETMDIPNEGRSEEHTSELQSRPHLVCRLLLEKK